MTDSAALRETPTTVLPRWWWARGLTLRERVAAPRVPAGRGSAGRGRTAPWCAGDEAGFAARLTSLGLDGGLASALGDELPERLGARAAEPEWAGYVERAVAAAPAEPGDRAESAGSGAEGPAVFLPALRPLLSPAWSRVVARTAPPAAEHAPLRAAFEERLGDRIARQAGRTLVRELHRARAAGRLSGATPRERFASFTADLGTRQGLARLFTRYPVLARMLGQSCADAADAMAELLGRLGADRAALVSELFGGADPGPLVRVDLGRGDPHQGGRSVALLHFASGAAAVYKPRPLDQHALLDEAVGWLNGKVPGLGLRTPRSVRGEGYGWLEFVEHRWCGSVTEADRFYRRQGALLALLYAVDGADMHYENVIACGDRPVPVDAETLFHSGLPQAETAGHDPAARALHASVHRTCLLPHLLIGEDGALDISALGRDGDGAYPGDGVRWADAGTDGMRVVRGPVESPAGQNQPLPPGRVGARADHRAALLEGFRAGYDAIAGHRGELLGTDGLLARWAHSPARLVVRSTRLYATLLEESTHPDLLRDALAREAVFAVLWTESVGDPARQRLIEHEIDDLWRGDVPLFLHRPDRTAVWTSRGARLDRVLPATALETVREKVAAMSEVDRYDQEWVISAALAVGGANSPVRGPRSALAVRPAPAVVPEPSRLLTAACGIADEIAARAVRGGGRANWLGLEQVTDAHWAVLPMGGGLAQGYCGVALFLAQIGALAGAERYTALAREAVRPLPPLLSALAADRELSAAVGPGALNGLGGIVYALVRLSTLLDGVGDCLPAALTALGHAVDAQPDGPGHASLADGLAGALPAAVLAHRVTGAAGAAETARRAADRLLAPAGEGRTGMPGFAHGDAGIGWALARYAAALPEAGASAPPYAGAGAALLRSALDASARGAGGLSWHAGLAGVASAAADALGTTGRAAPDGVLDRCVRSLAEPDRSGDLSLRHGALGRLEALAVLAERHHAGAKDALGHRSGEVLGLIEQQGHRCGTPDHVPSPGLLTGLSGIGYALLRLGFPETVPSVLLLDHPAGAPGGPGTVL
ncbi:type 2 lanthipeptide synthetase LanM family protein [Streptomyces sp. DH37]|uniref:type 2 lanthipeptide synthetase LanM family protein n=1 Tax=Streptomyces sp. DH37 TaxID=3040122 RepID=UPI0024427392|nr:type 2 lanthipeptide synthetase LanM family protein [Streptomyces sp. DH37]MDG9701468.1 type 2 lanthipeptide synthetase LanM family protein [Streptomyces sp. DH37]